MYGVPTKVCVVPVIPACSFHKFVYVCRKLSPHLESWITGVYSPYVVSLCDFDTMWSGKSLQLLCILPFGMFCLSAIIMMFVKILLAVCMLV